MFFNNDIFLLAIPSIIGICLGALVWCCLLGPLINKTIKMMNNETSAQNHDDVALKDIYISRTCYNKLEEFCGDHGMNKAGVAEQAIRKYIDEMNESL